MIIPYDINNKVQADRWTNNGQTVTENPDLILSILNYSKKSFIFPHSFLIG